MIWVAVSPEEIDQEQTTDFSKAKISRRIDPRPSRILLDEGLI
jgi:hypothetical protein